MSLKQFRTTLYYTASSASAVGIATAYGIVTEGSQFELR
jgi:hypothetical protein